MRATSYASHPEVTKNPSQRKLPIKNCEEKGHHEDIREEFVTAVVLERSCCWRNTLAAQ